jgi:hypothetical protein
MLYKRKESTGFLLWLLSWTIPVSCWIASLPRQFAVAYICVASCLPDQFISVRPRTLLQHLLLKASYSQPKRPGTVASMINKSISGPTRTNNLLITRAYRFVLPFLPVRAFRFSSFTLTELRFPMIPLPFSCPHRLSRPSTTATVFVTC